MRPSRPVARRESDAIEVAYVVGHRPQGLWTPWYRGVHLVVVLLLVRQNEVMLVCCDEIERPLNNLLVVGLGEVVNPSIPEDQID